MEKCTKITINWVEKLVGDWDLVVVKMQHPIERMKKHCYSYYQWLKPEEVVDVYNNDNTIRKYLSIYNNSYIPGYTIAEVNINIDYTYPSTFSLSTRQCNDPSYWTNFFFRYDSETMADDKVEIVDWIATKREACCVHNSFIEFSNHRKILDRSKYQDHDIWMVYDSIRLRWGCHTFSSQITVQDLLDYEQQQIIPDEADVAEARLAQIDVMHEVAEQQTPEEYSVNATLTNWQVVVQPNEDWTVTVPAWTETWDVHIDFENDNDAVESIVWDFNDELEDWDDADTNN